MYFSSDWLYGRLFPVVEVFLFSLGIVAAVKIRRVSRTRAFVCLLTGCIVAIIETLFWSVLEFFQFIGLFSRFELADTWEAVTLGTSCAWIVAHALIFTGLLMLVTEFRSMAERMRALEAMVGKAGPGE